MTTKSSHKQYLKIQHTFQTTILQIAIGDGTIILGLKCFISLSASLD